MAASPDRVPTHRCKKCSALWIKYPDSWSLYSERCGQCCDNAVMGDQIEPIGELVDKLAIELAYSKHVGLTLHETALKVLCATARPGAPA